MHRQKLKRQEHLGDLRGAEKTLQTSTEIRTKESNAQIGNS